MINTFKKMDRIRKRYLGFAVSIFLVFAAIMASIFAFQYDIINKIHATNTRDEIIEIKKDFLEDTVNNTVRYISEIKTLNETRFLERIKRLLIFIEEHAGTYGIDHIKDYLESGGVNENLVIITKNQGGAVFFESPTAARHKDSEYAEHFFAREEMVYDGYTVIIGA
ncbi:MAG: hypothetical protein GX173_05695, partial [Ruminococcaceae bacterium]|nr:hypothetical protein [Oscillospiraceae bacterium]